MQMVVISSLTFSGRKYKVHTQSMKILLNVVQRQIHIFSYSDINDGNYYSIETFHIYANKLRHDL